MERNLIFIKPIERWKAKKYDEKNWLKSKELFEQKKYIKSIKEIFNYIDKKSFKKYKVYGKNRYIIPNYRNWVEIEFDDKKINISMEVVKINNENFIFIARQLIDLNMNFFSLPKISIEGNIIKIIYSCYLDSALTWKIVRCLREMGNFSFIYTEKFIDLYNAELPKEPKIEYYKDKEYQNILEKINFLITQANKYGEYFEKKFEYSYAWEVVYQTILNIDCLSSIKGTLKREIDEVIDLMLDKSKDTKEQFFIGINFLNKLRELNTYDLKKSFYKTEEIFYTKKYYSEEDLSGYLSEGLSVGKNLISEENYIGATLNQRGWLLTSLYNANMEIKGNYNKIINTLLGVNNKDWKSCAKKINSNIKDLVLMNRKSYNGFLYFIALYMITMLIINLGKRLGEILGYLNN